MVSHVLNCHYLNCGCFCLFESVRTEKHNITIGFSGCILLKIEIDVIKLPVHDAVSQNSDVFYLYLSESV